MSDSAAALRKAVGHTCKLLRQMLTDSQLLHWELCFLFHSSLFSPVLTAFCAILAASLGSHLVSLSVRSHSQQHSMQTFLTGISQRHIDSLALTFQCRNFDGL